MWARCGGRGHRGTATHDRSGTSQCSGMWLRVPARGLSGPPDTHQCVRGSGTGGTCQHASCGGDVGGVGRAPSAGTVGAWGTVGVSPLMGTLAPQRTEYTSHLRGREQVPVDEWGGEGGGLPPGLGSVTLTSAAAACSGRVAYWDSGIGAGCFCTVSPPSVGRPRPRWRQQ